MKIIEPSVELIDKVDEMEVYEKIERCGRVCYQSYQFQNRKRYEEVPVRNERIDEDSLKGHICYEKRRVDKPATEFVRMLIKRRHESVLEHVNLTFHIICDRAVMAELTRHRLASFSVESTRYVKYNELTLVKPEFWNGYKESSLAYRVMQDTEKLYSELLELGAKPEQARAVLPLCLKTELYMTANLREWRHILRLRTSKHAHPQMREVANGILEIFREKLPVIVEDIS